MYKVLSLLLILLVITLGFVLPYLISVNLAKTTCPSQSTYTIKYHECSIHLYIYTMLTFWLIALILALCYRALKYLEHSILYENNSDDNV